MWRIYNLHHAAHVIDGVYKLEEFADVVGDGRSVWVHLPQILLVDLTDPCNNKQTKYASGGEHSISLSSLLAL